MPTKTKKGAVDNTSTGLRGKFTPTPPPVGGRLYDYAASHREPYALKAETIFQLCGSDAENLDNFRKVLRRAVKSLDASGLLKSVDITRAGLVRFIR